MSHTHAYRRISVVHVHVVTAKDSMSLGAMQMQVECQCSSFFMQLAYPVANTPRGDFVIMNNDQFYIHSKRPGSEYDFANLQKLAQELNMTALTELSGLKFTDLTGQVIKTSAEILSECCVCVNTSRCV